MQGSLWWGVALSAALALGAAWADRRRASRRDLDHVGWVPWPLVLMLAILVAAVLAAFALRS